MDENRKCCCHRPQEEEACEQNTQKYKHREDAEFQNLLHRINRIEGQVRGVRRMLEEERYCIDILNQVSAIQASLNAFNRVLLTDHIKSCVVDDIRAGDEEVVDELCAALQKLMK